MDVDGTARNKKNDKICSAKSCVLESIKKNFQSSFFAFTRRFGARLKFFAMYNSEYIIFVNASLPGDGGVIHETRTDGDCLGAGTHFPNTCLK